MGKKGKQQYREKKGGWSYLSSGRAEGGRLNGYKKANRWKKSRVGGEEITYRQGREIRFTFTERHFSSKTWKKRAILCTCVR